MSEFKVPFIDLQARYQEEREEILACLDRALTRGHLVLTEEVGEFEQAVADYTGAAHCVGLNSGTDAIMMALWGTGVGRGDEVIQSAISFVATTGATVHVGATPVFCDVGADQLIDPTEIERHITPKTKAIMPVHWTGRMCDMPSILEIAGANDLLVIEDSAQSMGSTMSGQHGGTFGAAGSISFHPLKNLNAIGDGGMLLTDDEEIARKVRLFRNHGLRARDDVEFYGVNSRLDVLHAEVLKYRLKRLDGVIEKRRRNANLYRELIKAEEVYIPEEKENCKDAYVMFLVLAERRDTLQAHLTEAGIQTLVYYGTPLHLHAAAKDLGYRKGDFPVAESQCERVLALPHHQQLSEDQVGYVAEQINHFYGVS